MTWAEFKNQLSVYQRSQVLANPKSPQYAWLMISLQKKAQRLRSLEL